LAATTLAATTLAATTTLAAAFGIDASRPRLQAYRFAHRSSRPTTEPLAPPLGLIGAKEGVARQ
jgi:hypothetical protein